MFTEIFIYLVIAFGILIIAMTMLEKDVPLDDKYMLIKNNKGKIIVKVKVEGYSKEEKEKIKEIIQNGKYDNIYDIADKFDIT